MGKAEVRSCTRCSEKLGMQKKGVAPGIAKASHVKPRPKKTSQLMLKGEKELVHDFAQRAIKARESKGWDKKMLAKKCAERVNVIQAVESGKTPTDSVVRKLERMLEIDLMEVPSHDGEQFVNSGSSSGMTLGDFLAKARRISMTEVHAIWLEQDDPKKNTAVRLSKHNLVKLHRRLNRLPRRGLF